MNRALITLSVSIIVLTITSCSQGPTPYPPDVNGISDDSTSDNTDDSELARGGSNELYLPSSMGIPPSDVMQQIGYVPQGGGDFCGLVCPDSSGVTLSGFAPYQEVRILVYSIYEYSSSCSFTVGDFMAEWYVTVDENGYSYMMVSGANPEGHFYFAYDAVTGKKIWGPGMQTVQETAEMCDAFSDDSSNTCPGARPQRMTVGGYGYVCTKTDNVKLREDPRLSGNEITRLSPGTGFYVEDGPACADNWSWWKISTEDGTVGWIAEGGDNVDPYFICP